MEQPLFSPHFIWLCSSIRHCWPHLLQETPPGAFTASSLLVLLPPFQMLFLSLRPSFSSVSAPPRCCPCPLSSFPWQSDMLITPQHVYSQSRPHYWVLGPFTWLASTWTATPDDQHITSVFIISPICLTLSPLILGPSLLPESMWQSSPFLQCLKSILLTAVRVIFS